MTCREFEEIVEQLAREEPGEAAALQHAAVCKECAARLASERRVTAALRAYAAGSANAGAPQRVEDALVAAFRRTKAVRPARNYRRAWISALAAGVAVFAIAVGLLPRDPVQNTLPAAVAIAGPDEVTTEYFPLQYGTDLTALDGAPVVRMELPRTVVVSFGLPMNPERAAEPIKADVVLGRDGIARAVRFVQ
jgi:hypothetical protein